MADGASGITHGGNGGTISLNAGSAIVNYGLASANGGSAKYGGSGGLVAASYVTKLPNTGTIRAQGASGILGTGGNGGLIDLVSRVNPNLNGLITASAGRGSLGFSSGVLGSVVTADPGHTSNTLIGTLRRVQSIEAITNAENYIMLMRSDVSTEINTVYALLNHAQIRSDRRPKIRSSYG
jgi:hypothetical protein